jgi:hypothetical protein
MVNDYNRNVAQVARCDKVLIEFAACVKLQNFSLVHCYV